MSKLTSDSERETARRALFRLRERITIDLNLLADIREKDDALRVYFARRHGVRIHSTWLTWYTSLFPNGQIPSSDKEDDHIKVFVRDNNLQRMHDYFQRVAEQHSIFPTVELDDFQKTFSDNLNSKCPYTPIVRRTSPVTS